jgi:hypothetical protein
VSGEWDVTWVLGGETLSHLARVTCASKNVAIIAAGSHSGLRLSVAVLSVAVLGVAVRRSIVVRKVVVLSTIIVEQRCPLGDMLVLGTVFVINTHEGRSIEVGATV